jgi:hypothetical protein
LKIIAGGWNYWLPVNKNGRVKKARGGRVLGMKEKLTFRPA